MGRRFVIRKVYQRSLENQRQINRQRKADGLPPTYGETVTLPSDRRIPRQDAR